MTKIEHKFIDLVKKIGDRGSLVIAISSVVFDLQGQPLGFDTKYLALADRNMQVRFSLKVVWGS